MQRYVPPLLRVDAGRAAGVCDNCGQLRADGIGEADVRHQAFAEERRDAAARAIEELIGDDEIERPVFLLQRSDGAQAR